MARPIQTRKKSVDLAAPVARVSRIRRDPPPLVKEVTAVDIKEREARTVVIGVITFALALVVILIGFATAKGWRPSEHTIYIRQDG